MNTLSSLTLFCVKGQVLSQLRYLNKGTEMKYHPDNIDLMHNCLKNKFIFHDRAQ